ncbi:MAG: glycosyltransferase [Candidatus Rokubacteria bacterium]|nr:glycosyltransferase [Candidatus Rokubacteria bacterium]
MLHFPDWRGGYQGLLAEWLADVGVDVAFADYVGALLPLVRNLRRHRCEILHLHWIAEVSGADERNPLKYVLKQLVFRLDVILASLLTRGRIVWTVHNLTSHENRHPRGDLAARRFLARRAASLIAHSPSARALISRTYGTPPERILLVPHGHYLDRYENAVGRRESRRRLGLDDDAFVFLFFGSLRPYKGVEDLVAAFERRPEPHARLVIAGPASDARYLETIRARASAERVLLRPGFVDDKDVQVFFNAADVVVLPFRDVLTSASVILAMSFARMVVAPRLGCIPDYVHPDGGILYDPQAPGALAAALARAVETDAIACGRRNLERVREFEWSDAAARTARLYATLTAPAAAS